MACHCNTPKDNGDYEPCCFNTGYCMAHYINKGIGMCVHCGAEMFEEDGFWYHHSQSETPVEERRTMFQESEEEFKKDNPSLP